MSWSKPEEARLRIMISAGASFDRIAAVMRKTPWNIHQKARELGIHPTQSASRPVVSLPKLKWLERPDP